VITVVSSPSIMSTLSKVRFTTSTPNFNQPDLSAACSVQVSYELTVVSDIKHNINKKLVVDAKREIVGKRHNFVL